MEISTATPAQMELDTSSDAEIARRLQLDEDSANIPWPNPLLTLHNPSLIVRPYHPSDAAVLARLGNNKNIQINMTDRWPFPYTVEEAQKFIAKSLNPKLSNTYAWTISLTPDGEPIGGCGFEPGQDVFCKNAEIGYWLAEPYWGKGYMTAVCEAMTAWAFRSETGVAGHKLQRIGAGVFDGNPGSGKVLKKCGYKHSGTMHSMVWKWDELRDMEIWELTRKEWEKKYNRKSAREEGLRKWQLKNQMPQEYAIGGVVSSED